MELIFSSWAWNTIVQSRLIVISAEVKTVKTVNASRF
jgi:hypothetical protein